MYTLVGGLQVAWDTLSSPEQGRSSDGMGRWAPAGWNRGGISRFGGGNLPGGRGGKRGKGDNQHSADANRQRSSIPVRSRKGLNHSFGGGQPLGGGARPVISRS